MLDSRNEPGPDKDPGSNTLTVTGCRLDPQHAAPHPRDHRRERSRRCGRVRRWSCRRHRLNHGYDLPRTTSCQQQSRDDRDPDYKRTPQTPHKTRLRRAAACGKGWPRGWRTTPASLGGASCSCSRSSGISLCRSTSYPTSSDTPAWVSTHTEQPRRPVPAW